MLALALAGCVDATRLTGVDAPSPTRPGPRAAPAEVGRPRAFPDRSLATAELSRLRAELASIARDSVKLTRYLATWRVAGLGRAPTAQELAATFADEPPVTPEAAYRPQPAGPRGTSTRGRAFSLADATDPTQPYPIEPNPTEPPTLSGEQLLSDCTKLTARINSGETDASVTGVLEFDLSTKCVTIPAGLLWWTTTGDAPVYRRSEGIDAQPFHHESWDYVGCETLGRKCSNTVDVAGSKFVGGTWCSGDLYQKLSGTVEGTASVTALSTDKGFVGPVEVTIADYLTGTCGKPATPDQTCFDTRATNYHKPLPCVYPPSGGSGGGAGPTEQQIPYSYTFGGGGGNPGAATMVEVCQGVDIWISMDGGMTWQYSHSYEVCRSESVR